MDFHTIRQKLGAGAYAEPWAVIEDFELVFENARKYNRKTSEVYRSAVKVTSNINPSHLTLANSQF